LLSVAIVCVAADVTSIVDKATAEVEAQVDASRAAAAKAVADAQATALAAARSAADSAGNLTAADVARIAADNEKVLRGAGIAISGENGGAAGAKSEGKNAASVSSVWMSASLLIVVTLANVLVC
ncbi:uncharacterized protein TM35_000901120, partial [Trypanosoma theileri]